MRPAPAPAPLVIIFRSWGTDGSRPVDNDLRLTAQRGACCTTTQYDNVCAGTHLGPQTKANRRASCAGVRGTPRGIPSTSSSWCSATCRAATRLPCALGPASLVQIVRTMSTHNDIIPNFVLGVKGNKTIWKTRYNIAGQTKIAMPCKLACNVVCLPNAM